MRLIVYGKQWSPETTSALSILKENGVEFHYEEFSGETDKTLPIFQVVGYDGCLVYECSGVLTTNKIKKLQGVLK